MSNPPFNVRLAAFLIYHPVLIGFVLLAIVGASAVLAPRLRSEAGVSIYFDKNRPLNKANDEISERFVSDDMVFAAFEADDVFAPSVLADVRAFGEAVYAMKTGENIDDVRSLTTIDDLVGEDDGFHTEKLVPEDEIPSDTSRIKARALNNPLIRDQLISPSGKVGLAVIRFRNGLADETKAEVVRDLRQLIATRVSPLKWSLAGQPVIEVDLAQAQQDDVRTFIPWVYLALGLLVVVFVRRFIGVLVALGSVIASVLTAFAMLVATNSSLNNTSAMLAPAVMALNVALFVHFFSEYAHAHGTPEEVFGDLLPPVAMAELTTVLGFFGLASARVPAVREFGIAAGLAVIVSFVTTTCILALVCRFIAPERLASKRGLVHSEKIASGLAAFSLAVIRHRVPILIGATLSVVFAVLGGMRINVDQDVTTFFTKSSSIRQATNLIDKELGGSAVVLAAIDGGRRDRFTEPQALAKLNALAVEMRRLGAQRTLTATDHVQLMHREFMGGDAAELRIPDTQQQIAQLLLLNGDWSLEEYIDTQHRWVRVMARTPQHGAKGMLALYHKLDDWLARNFPSSDGYNAIAVASSRLEATLADELVGDQMGSLVWSGFPIVIIMVFLLRSVRLGLFSLVPNIYPIFMSFGVMGWCGIELNIATVMTATVALGIVVDDTVHFLRSLAMQLRAHGDLPRAVSETMRDKGVGMLGTAAVIMLAFIVLAASDFLPTRNFAILMCVVMVTALIGDMIIMPAALVTFGAKRLALRRAGFVREEVPS